MGSTLSCAGKGHSPKDQDLKPYGASLPKANGIVAPSEKYIVPSDDSKTTNNNNNNNKAGSTLTRQQSWRFWQRLSLRRTGKRSSGKQMKLPPFLEEKSVPNERLPDVVDTKGAFTRSASMKPPPKPPRLFLFRSSSINTPRSSVIGETDRNSFVLSQAYQNGSKGSENIKAATDSGQISETKEVKNLRDSISEPIPNVVQISNPTRPHEYSNVPISHTLPKDSGTGHTGPVVIRRSPHKSPTGKIKIVSPELSRKPTSHHRKRPSDITAEDRHVLIMQSASELICQKLEPFAIIEDLHKAKILGKEDLTAFKGHPDRRLICENIIQAVTDKEYNAFLRFCDILRDITDYATVAAVLDAMRAVYDVIYEIPASSGDKSPILDDDKTISFDVVYYSLESGKIRSVVELEKARASENRRFSRDFLLSKRNSRLSFHSLTSEASSIFMEDIINNGIPMVTIAIAGHDLNGEKAKCLASVIEQNSCILELHMGKTHLKGPDMEPIFQSLQFTSGLRVLDLRLNSVGNHGASFIAAALQTNRTLRQLNLSSTGIEMEGCKHLAESLRYNTTLAELDLSFLDIGDSGCMALGGALKQNRALQKLRLRSDNISWIGAGFLIEGIEVSRVLTELDLSRNFIGDDGAEILARHLGDNSSLKELNLENCGFTSVGCSMLSDMVLTNKSIVHLDLSTNFIGDQGVLKLSNALERNKSIRTLGLNLCGITNDGFAKLLDILEANPTLTLLKLCYNRLGGEHSNPDATSDSLKYRIRIVTSSNPKLKLLLWGNTFDDSLNTISQMTRDVTATL